MEKEIKQIELIFENVEDLIIPIEYIIDIRMMDFKRVFSRRAINAFGWSETMDTFALLVASEFNTSGHTFSFDDCLDAPATQTVLERLAFRTDLVGVSLTAFDGTRETFYVHWEGSNDYHNPAFRAMSTPKGDLLLTIASAPLSEELNAFVDLIENSDDLSGLKEWYDIGDAGPHTPHDLLGTE